jgi:hypothetical protein
LYDDLQATQDHTKRPQKDHLSMIQEDVAPSQISSMVNKGLSG